MSGIAPSTHEFFARISPNINVRTPFILLQVIGEQPLNDGSMLFREEVLNRQKKKELIRKQTILPLNQLTC